MNLDGFKKAKEICHDILRQGHEKDPNLLRGNAYVDSCRRDSSYKSYGDGVLCKVLKKGSGELPRENAAVCINYSMWLSDGTELLKNQTHYYLSVSNGLGMAGFSQALTHMPVGSVWEIVIPERLAHGASEFGKIKAFSTVIMKVELLSVE